MIDHNIWCMCVCSGVLAWPQRGRCFVLVDSLEILRDVCATKHICRVCHTLSAELLRLEDAVGADVLWLEAGM